MDNERLTEMVYNTDKVVSVLSKDVESIKQDIKEFKDTSKENMAKIDAKLEKLINEPQESLKFFKNKIFSLIISGVAVLMVFGMGVWVTKITTETKQITQQHAQATQE